MIPFPNKKYHIIYADPPWSYENKTDCGGNRGNFVDHISKQFNVMSFEDIYRLPVSNITATDCLLFLWVVSPNLVEGIETGKRWGFQFKTIAFVWNKIYVMPGNYTMSQCELCLVFKKGRIPAPRSARNIKQYIQTKTATTYYDQNVLDQGLYFEQVITEKRTRHSEKPSEVRYRIEQMFPNQTKIELFARKRYLGWDAWGDELPEEKEELFTY